MRRRPAASRIPSMPTPETNTGIYYRANCIPILHHADLPYVFSHAATTRRLICIEYRQHVGGTSGALTKV
jgi:hypothetical protein